MTSQYGAYALLSGLARLRAHTHVHAHAHAPRHAHARARTHHRQILQYIFLFHGNNGFANVPQYCVIGTLPVMLHVVYVNLGFLY